MTDNCCFNICLSNFDLPEIRQLQNYEIHPTTGKKFWNPQQIRSVYTNISSKILISRSYVLQRMIKLLEILSVHSNMLFSLLPGDAYASSNTLATLQRHNTETEQIFPEKMNCAVSVPISTFMCLWVIYVYIPTIGLPILLQENTWTDPENK